ncbi:unnamed protein product [Effrenium voratum]|nr:unnamed protein product [Effrenium voratum]
MPVTREPCQVRFARSLPVRRFKEKARATVQAYLDFKPGQDADLSRWPSTKSLAGYALEPTRDLTQSELGLQSLWLASAAPLAQWQLFDPARSEPQALTEPAPAAPLPEPWQSQMATPHLTASQQQVQSEPQMTPATRGTPPLPQPKPESGTSQPLTQPLAWPLFMSPAPTQAQPQASDQPPPPQLPAQFAVVEPTTVPQTDQPQSQGPDPDMVDEVTKHLLLARDKIEAVEREFAQIMGELASYGRKSASSSGLLLCRPPPRRQACGPDRRAAAFLVEMLAGVDLGRPDEAWRRPRTLATRTTLRGHNDLPCQQQTLERGE